MDVPMAEPEEEEEEEGVVKDTKTTNSDDNPYELSIDFVEREVARIAKTRDENVWQEMKGIVFRYESGESTWRDGIVLGAMAQFEWSWEYVGKEKIRKERIKATEKLFDEVLPILRAKFLQPVNWVEDLQRLPRDLFEEAVHQAVLAFAKGSLTYRQWNLTRVVYRQYTRLTIAETTRPQTSVVVEKGGVMAAHREALKDLWVFAELLITSPYRQLNRYVHQAFRTSQISELLPHTGRGDIRYHAVRRDIGARKALNKMRKREAMPEFLTTIEFTNIVLTTVTAIRSGTPAPPVLQQPPRLIEIQDAPERLRGKRSITFTQALSILLNASVTMSWAASPFFHGHPTGVVTDILRMTRRYGTLEQRAAASLFLSYLRVGQSWRLQRRPNLARLPSTSDWNPTVGKENLPWYRKDRLAVVVELEAKLDAGSYDFRDWNLTERLFYHDRRPDSQFPTTSNPTDRNRLEALYWKGGEFAARKEVTHGRWMFALHVIENMAVILVERVRAVEATASPWDIIPSRLEPHSAAFEHLADTVHRITVHVTLIREAALPNIPVMLRMPPAHVAHSSSMKGAGDALQRGQKWPILDWLAIFANVFRNAAWMGHSSPFYARFSCILSLVQARASRRVVRTLDVLEKYEDLNYEWTRRQRALNMAERIKWQKVLGRHYAKYWKP